MNFNLFVLFCCERHVKQLVFIINYDINFLLSLPKWLFLVHESISCVLSVLVIPTSCFIVKLLFEKSTKLQSLSKCMSKYFKEHVLTLMVN